VVLTGQALARAYVWVVVSSPSSSPFPGSTFTTDLRVSSWNGTAAALDLTVHYDPAVLKIVDFSTPSDSEFYPNCFADSASYTSGQTRITCFQVTNWEVQDPSVSFGTLTWEVVGAACLVTDVVIEPASLVDARWRPVEVMSYGQRIAVGPPGDLDGNGSVDVADIMQVANRWRMTDEDPDWEARYDLNGDGIITVVDIMLVVAHWGESCSPQQTCVPDWTLACGGSDRWNNGNMGSTDRIDTYSCTTWDESGPEYAYDFVPSVSSQVDVSLSDLSADIDLFIVAPGCNATNCLAYGDVTASFDAVAGQPYYIVVDGYQGAVGDYTISVSCPAGAQDQGDQEPGKSRQRFNFATVVPEVATPHPTPVH
jgi:hypothetical protein